MVSNFEIVDAFVRGKGRRLNGGNVNSLVPLAHFFMVDAAYAIFCRSVRGMEARHEARMMIGRLNDAFNMFFKDFRAPLTEEMRDIIIDRTDEIQAVFEHDLEIARISIMETVNHRPMDEQGLIADMVMMLVLAKDGQDLYLEIYKDRYGHSVEDKNIRAIVTCGERLLAMYVSQSEIRRDRTKRVQDALHVIANKVVKWLMDDMWEETRRVEGT